MSARRHRREVGALEIARLKDPEKMREAISRCEQTLEPIHLRVGREGPEPEAVVAHFEVPAAKWWADLVYT